MARKQEAEAPVRRRILRWLAWTGAAAGAACVIAAAYQCDEFLASSPRFVLPGNPARHPTLEIRGVKHAPAARVSAVFADDFGKSIYLMPLAARRRSLLAIEWVRDATVSRRWPNGVRVDIVERTPVAFVLLPAGGDAFETALIDADGVILNPPAGAGFDLPAVRGIRRDQPIAGRQERVRLAITMMRELKAQAAQVSEIDATDTENLRLTYTANGRAVRLMMGNHNFLPRLTNFLSHYDEIQRRLPTARLFDLRLDDRITASTEEASSGG
jgi:cell division protein FtsQ